MGLHVNGNEDGKFLKGAMWNPDQNNSIRGLIAKSGEKVPQCVWTEKRDAAGASYYEHDSEGRVIRILHDSDEDGNPDMIETCKYHASGAKEEVVVERYRDGKLTGLYVETSEFNEQGQKIKTTEDFNGDGAPDTTYEYNELGQEVKHTHYNENGSRYSEDTTEYDTNGNRTVHHANYDDSGKVSYGEIHKYDASGRLLMEGVDLHGEGKYREVKAYEYDGFGNLVKEAADYDGEGKYHDIKTYEYDGSGNLIKETVDDDGDGKPERVETFEYNESGERVKHHAVYPRAGYEEVTEDGPEAWQTTVTQKSYDNDGNLSWSTVQTQSSSSGRLIKKYEDADGDGTAEKTTSFYGEGCSVETTEYDTNGNKTVREEFFKRVDHSFNGPDLNSLSVSVIRKYDASGRLIKESVDANGDGEYESIQEH